MSDKKDEKCKHPDLGIDEKTGEHICFMCGLPTSEWNKKKKCCLFCSYSYESPNSNVSEDDVIGHIINHMSLFHENQLEILEEKLLYRELKKK